MQKLHRQLLCGWIGCRHSEQLPGSNVSGDMVDMAPENSSKTNLLVCTRAFNS